MTPAPIRLGLPPAVPWLLLVGSPLAAGALAWLVAHLARAAGTLPWVPFDGPLALIATVPVPWFVLAFTVIGLGVGAWLAMATRHEDLVLTVGSQAVEAQQGDRVETFQRDEVAGVLRDGKDVVLLARDGGELLRGASEASRAAIRAACEAMGYPWLEDGDPFAPDWRPWADGHPDLDARAHALLRLRQATVAGDDRGRARELARELTRLGVVVRDGAGGQMVRAKAPPASA